MKTQTQYTNKIEVIRHKGIFVVHVNDVVAHVAEFAQDVQDWLWLNWPVGTQVKWVVKP